MESGIIIQGRWMGPSELGLVRHLLSEHPGWCRSQLSRELCTAWDWRNGTGRIKDMACRTLLLTQLQQFEKKIGCFHPVDS